MKRFEHGGKADDSRIILDFSANINPLGMPQNVKKALINGVDGFSAYPDTDCTALREKLAVYENVKAENIVCGNGAADLIYRIVYAVQPKKALLLSPTFSEYEKALVQADCHIDFYCLSESNNFLPDEKILDMLADDTDILFLCNPNNPTGNVADRTLMKKITDKCREKNILLAVDECFMNFCTDREKYSSKTLLNDGIIILKAFTKIYAMAGLRLGYALCGSEKLAEKICSIGQCWSVSAPAQLAGIAALDEVEYVAKSAVLIAEECDFLRSALKNRGFKVYPSVTNFLLFKSAIPLEEKLAEQGFALRSCDNFRGLDGYFYRTAIRLHSENERLINALERIVGNG